ncbi:hypothetical protein DPSP01_009713 [Paraphaeosphaeria sporulosa]
MPTTPPDPRRYRREVQSRIRSLLSGQRPRHPVLSQYGTGRLILEGVLEETRIYRLNKELKVLKAREEAARMHERGTSRGRDGRREEQGESCRAGRRRNRLDEEHKKPLLAGNLTHLDAELHGESPGFMMSGGALGPPPLDKAAAQSEHRSPGNPKKWHGHPHLHSGESSFQGRQRFDRHGKPLIHGKRGWRDASPAPFPEYKFKKGPMLGLGDHLKERFQWGVDNYHLKQRRRERRERGSLHERRDVRKGKGAELDKKVKRQEGRPISKSEGKRAVKQDHSSDSPKNGPSREVRSPGKRDHARPVEKFTEG